MTKQHDLLMKKKVEDENFIKQLQIQQNTDKIYIEQLKSQSRSETEQVKKSAMDING